MAGRKAHGTQWCDCLCMHPAPAFPGSRQGGASPWGVGSPATQTPAHSWVSGGDRELQGRRSVCPGWGIGPAGQSEHEVRLRGWATPVPPGGGDACAGPSAACREAAGCSTRELSPNAVRWDRLSGHTRALLFSKRPLQKRVRALPPAPGAGAGLLAGAVLQTAASPLELALPRKSGRWSVRGVRLPAPPRSGSSAQCPPHECHSVKLFFK